MENIKDLELKDLFYWHRDTTTPDPNFDWHRDTTVPDPNFHWQRDTTTLDPDFYIYLENINYSYKN